jgi:cell division protease FtsH
MSPRLRTVAVWVLLTVVFFAAWTVLRTPDDGTPRVSEATFYDDLSSNRLVEVQVDEHDVVYGMRADGTSYRTGLRYTDSVDARIRAAGVPVGWWSGATEEEGFDWTVVLVAAGVVLALVVLVVVRLRQQNTGSILTLKRTTARLVAERPKVGWNDVGGAERAKRDLMDAVAFMKKPEAWVAAGARAPRGILLEGPPGSGKTLLAKALASEAQMPFFEVSATEFVELFVGVGAARVRDLFDEAKKKAPCVVFIDEIDAVGRRRGGASTSLTHQEREQALDQLLVCMDGFRPRDAVIVVAATNRADVLDPALIRPGRFDVVLRVGDFDEKDRRAILEVHLRGKPVAAGLDLNAIAMSTPGASGAELEQIVNTAAMEVARRGEAKPTITQADLLQAVEQRKKAASGLDALDLFLTESASALTRPTSPLDVELSLRSGDVLRGQVLWGEPHSLKLRTSEGPLVVARLHVVSIRATSEPLPVEAEAVRAMTPGDQPDAG